MGVIPRLSNSQLCKSVFFYFFGGSEISNSQQYWQEIWIYDSYRLNGAMEEEDAS